MSKLYDYLGEVFECMDILTKHFEKAKLEKSKLNAKIRFLYILELKRTLIFHTCKAEGEAFIKEYSGESEIYAWKYLYRTNVILAKLF